MWPIAYRHTEVNTGQHVADGELPGGGSGGAGIYLNHFVNSCSTFLNKLRVVTCSPQIHIQSRASVM